MKKEYKILNEEERIMVAEDIVEGLDYEIIAEKWKISRKTLSRIEKELIVKQIKGRETFNSIEGNFENINSSNINVDSINVDNIKFNNKYIVHDTARDTTFNIKDDLGLLDLLKETVDCPEFIYSISYRRIQEEINLLSESKFHNLVIRLNFEDSNINITSIIKTLEFKMRNLEDRIGELEKNV